jgi:hypothetical protein
MLTGPRIRGLNAIRFTIATRKIDMTYAPCQSAWKTRLRAYPLPMAGTSETLNDMI